MISRSKSLRTFSLDYLFFAGLVLLAGWFWWSSAHQSPKPPPVTVASRHPDSLLMQAVSKVSVEASLLLLSPLMGLGMPEPIACAMAKRALERKDMLASLLKQWDAECALGKMVREATEPVFQAIVDSRALPQVAVTFDVYVQTEEKWQTVGLFADLDTCTRMAGAAMSLGMGVRACLPWAPRF